jgi:ABC-2 type transport system ATP-binding protein
MSNQPVLMIETRGLTRRFGEVTAVNGLDLAIKRGEIFGIVGPDGAGKTTTLRLLCGLMDPSEGEIRVAGHDVLTEPALVRDRIGYMPQQFGQYLDLTVEENMYFYADLFGIVGADRDGLMARLLQMTRMEPFRGRRAGKLSGGMKQKLALMCTLLHRPEALFLDEPTNGVDPVSRRDFWAILYQLVKEGLTVLITTAYLDEAERCNRVALMYHGRVIREAPPGELKQSLGAPCFALRCANARAARELLRKRSGVVNVESSGGELHLFVDNAERMDQIKPELDSQGFGPVESRAIAPSLEDTFIAFIRREDEAAVAGAAE